jgi:hypothetical protein
VLRVGLFTTPLRWPVAMQEDFEVLDEADEYHDGRARQSHEEEDFKRTHED